MTDRLAQPSPRNTSNGHSRIVETGQNCPNRLEMTTPVSCQITKLRKCFPACARASMVTPEQRSGASATRTSKSTSCSLRLSSCGPHAFFTPQGRLSPAAVLLAGPEGLSPTRRVGAEFTGLLSSSLSRRSTTLLDSSDLEQAHAPDVGLGVWNTTLKNNRNLQECMLSTGVYSL